MMKSKLMVMVLAFGLIAIQPLMGSAYADEQADTILQKRAYNAAYTAYIYGLAPVMAKSVEINNTSVDYPLDSGPAPVNTLTHASRLFDYRDTVVPTLNNETLYFSSWMILKNSPLVLSIPRIKNRYFIAQLLNIYTEAIENLTVENVGENGGNYVFVLESQKEKYKNLPKGVTPIYCDTPTLWLIGRVGVASESDVEAAIKVAEALTLTPLDQFAKGKITKRLKPRKTESGAQPVPIGGIMQFYSRLDDVIRNEPLEKDKVLTDQFKVIGIGADEPFDPKKLSKPILAGLEAGAKDAEEAVRYAAKNSETVSGGWNLELNGGRYGTDFLARAAINLNSIGLNTPERAMYPKRFVDADGNNLVGSSIYEITIPAKSLVRKEVNGFWSITMYDAKNRFMVKNQINRYSIGDHTAGIQKNRDGSLTIYISNIKPNDVKQMANWLPAPEGEFMLQYRLYEPKKEVYTGKVELSQLHKVK